MEGAGAVPGRIDKGKPQKRGLPAFLAILFVSSHDVNVPSPLPKKGRDCKVSKKGASVQIPRGIFSGRARKKAPSAVCGCKGTARNPFFPNFIPTFFEKNISYHKNTLYIKHIIPQKNSQQHQRPIPSPTIPTRHPLLRNLLKIYFLRPKMSAKFIILQSSCPPKHKVSQKQTQNYCLTKKILNKICILQTQTY